MKKKGMILCMIGLMAVCTACGNKKEKTAVTTERVTTEAVSEEETESTEPDKTEETTKTGTTEAASATETEEATTVTATEAVTTEATTTEASADTGSRITQEQAEALLTENLGTEDAATGNTYSFGYADTVTVDGDAYYVYIWSWLVDNNHFSRIADLFVRVDGSAIYEGQYGGDSTSSSIPDKENMMK